MKSANPILVIDRDGIIGKPLSVKLSKEFLVVLVSRKGLDLRDENKSILHVPFFGRFPTIPDNKYSHIIFIDGERQCLELLPKIIDKAKGVNSDFIFAQGLSPKGDYAVNKILRAYPSAKIAILGDIFDNKLILEKENFKSAVNSFIYQAQRFGKIQIFGEGLRDVYPVFLPDAVDGLIDLMFGINQIHSLFYIFSKHPTTELSLAHIIQKINPEIMVDFIKHDPGTENRPYPLNGKYLLNTKYPISQKMRNINVERNFPVVGKAQDENIHGNRKGLGGFLFFIVWVLIFLLLFPVVFAIFFSFLGLNTLYYAKREINKGNFIYAKSSLHLAQTFFYVGKQTLDILSLQAKIVGRENDLKALSQNLDSGYKLSEAILQAFNSGTYFLNVLNGKSEDPTDDFAKAQNYLKSSIVMLSKIKAEGKIPAPMLQNMESISPLIRLLSSVSDAMPGIFGMEGQQTYLILFQDNMELRPGGGFIGSYGILKLNMGKIIQFSIHDVYDDADRQLRGHVEPPFAVRRYLPSEHWYMKDSNFDVDFAESASASSNFLFAETGQKVSGVIGADTSFAKNILRATGPVYLADYNKTADEDNIFLLMQSQTEKSFSRSLYKAIIAKISEAKIPYLLIAQAISDSLAQKHLVFSLNNKPQNIFTVNGWSSSLWDERTMDENSVNDFVGINEANLGLNNVNNFIFRQVTHRVTMGNNGKILEELDVSYKNASTALSGGNYKNYLRIILPMDSAISGILINGVPQILVDAVTDPLVYEKGDFKPPAGLELEKVQEKNKTIYGFIINIPAGKIVKVEVRYELPNNVSALSAFSYNLKLFKQPGIDSIPYSFSLFYPDSLNIINTTDGIKKEDGRVFYSKKIAEDENLVVNFAGNKPY